MRSATPTASACAMSSGISGCGIGMVTMARWASAGTCAIASTSVSMPRARLITPE